LWRGWSHSETKISKNLLHKSQKKFCGKYNSKQKAKSRKNKDKNEAREGRSIRSDERRNLNGTEAAPSKASITNKIGEDKQKTRKLNLWLT